MIIIGIGSSAAAATTNKITHYLQRDTKGENKKKTNCTQLLMYCKCHVARYRDFQCPDDDDFDSKLK